MKKILFFLFGAIALAAFYIWLMPSAQTFLHPTPQGKYGSVRIFQWKWLLGNSCQGSLDGYYWATMSVNDIKKTNDGFLLSDGAGKSLRISTYDGMNVTYYNFDNRIQKVDSCDELGSGGIETEAGTFSLKTQDVRLWDMTTSFPSPTRDNVTIRVWPWEKSFLDLELDLPDGFVPEVMVEEKK